MSIDGVNTAISNPLLRPILNGLSIFGCVNLKTIKTICSNNTRITAKVCESCNTTENSGRIMTARLGSEKNKIDVQGVFQRDFQVKNGMLK